MAASDVNGTTNGVGPTTERVNGVNATTSETIALNAGRTMETVLAATTDRKTATTTATMDAKKDLAGNDPTQ